MAHDPTMDHFLFLHAHPDDEAIFTGGTLSLLASLGVGTTIVVATSGDTDHRSPEPGTLAAIRRAETLAAARSLGVDDVRFLDYADSGIATSQTRSVDAFVDADLEQAAHRVAEIATEVGATALVYYDDGGIYGHLDHLKVHAVGTRAAAIANLATTYQATVDHEYLHFVDTHLVGLAALALHSEAVTGMPTVFISTTIGAASVIDRKRAAMAAHESQIPSDSEALQLTAEAFAAVYGYEWFVRSGPPTILDRLGL